MLKYWEKRGEDAFVRAQDGGFINNKCLALKLKDDVIVPKVGFRKKGWKGKRKWDEAERNDKSNNKPNTNVVMRKVRTFSAFILS